MSVSDITRRAWLPQAQSPATGAAREDQRGAAVVARWFRRDRDFATGSQVISAVARRVRLHALGWLVAANLVGVLLAAELVWPAFGDRLAPLTYGRWMPLHLNWQLYGWCALPLIGVLLHRLLDSRHPHAVAHAHVALGSWSLALGAGGIAWLGGVASGKLFLDWSGWARPLLPVAMLVLWTILAAHAWWRAPEPAPASARNYGQMAVLVLLTGLLAVPPLMYWASGREVYPSVNPHSGGATGTSLLGSTLGIVAIFGLLPVLLGVAPVSARRSRARTFPLLLVVSVAVFGRLDHGHASHRTIEQVVGLGVLLAWIPMLIAHWRRYAWSEGGRPWLTAACAWWSVLVVTGWVTFLPGVSEQLKFTNALVAHAHLAMAGLVTSVNFAVLNQLDPQRPLRRGFWWWQGGCAVHVGVLALAGWVESARWGEFFGSEPWTQVVYGVRLLAGLVMAAASLGALVEAGEAQ